jgi:hypothetical protein
MMGETSMTSCKKFLGIFDKKIGPAPGEVWLHTAVGRRGTKPVSIKEKK